MLVCIRKAFLVFVISLHSMVDNTNWYIVGSTVALVAITAYYAYQTRELARRPFTPLISASFNIISHDAREEQRGNIVLDIRNVGTGTATDVSIEHSVPAHNIAGQVTHFVSMLPGEVGQLSVPIPLPQRGASILIHLEYKYKDIFGKKYERKEDVPGKVCQSADLDFLAAMSKLIQSLQRTQSGLLFVLCKGMVTVKVYPQVQRQGQLLQITLKLG